jgi:hypothetical protein
VPTLYHHLTANVNVPIGAPLFIFEADDGDWEPLAKSNWLAWCNEIWVAAGFSPLKAHAFRIGSSRDIVVVTQGCQGSWVVLGVLVWFR